MAARVLVAAQFTVGTFPTLPISANAADLTETAGDATNGHYTPLVENKTCLQFHNTGAGARTATILSAADPTTNRTGDITAYSLGAGEISKLFGPFKAQGWSQYGPDVTLANPSAAADDIIDTSAAHGFVAGDAVRFTALTGGTGLVVDTTYYVSSVSLGTTTFRVSASSGSTPLTFSTDITAGIVVKADANVWWDVSHAEMKTAVITLP